MTTHPNKRINPMPFVEFRHGCVQIDDGNIRISSIDEMGLYDSSGSFWGTKGKSLLSISVLDPTVGIVWRGKPAQAIYCQLGLLYGIQVEEPQRLTAQVRINRRNTFKEFDIETSPWPYGGWYGGVDKDGIPIPRHGIFIAKFLEPADLLDYVLSVKTPRELKVRIAEVSLRRPQKFDLKLIQTAFSYIAERQDC